MKVLFVTDFYHPYSGGVEQHVRTVASSLVARGHQVAVATLPAPPGKDERTADGEVAVFTVHHSAERIGARFAHQDRPWAPPMPDPVTMKGLRTVVRRFEPDVIHGHDWLARSVLPAVVSGRIPVVTSLHYYTRTCAKKTLWRDDQICSGPELKLCLRCAGQHYGKARGTIVTLGLRLGSKLEDRRTDRLISVSEATAAGNGVRGRPNAAIIANPVANPVVALDAGSATGDDRPDRAMTDGSDAELPPGVPDGPFILFVGDIRPEKGVAVLAGAVELLRSEYGDQTPFVVVGERMSESIGLPDGTIEVGRVPNPVVQALWARATIGVVPSLWPEPFGMVAIEAMAAGCPLVASDVGGLSEILADGRGTLVPAGDCSVLASAMAELLADPNRRRRQADLARVDAARYSTEVIVDQIEEQYRLAIERRPT